MSLTWHIIQKDFRRLLWPLGLWLLLPLAQLALLHRTAGQAVQSTAAFESMTYLFNTWSVLTWMGGFILAAWLVMEDTLAGTQAFWQTRPIKGTRLLAAKAMGAILMFGILPVLVMVPVWSVGGFSARELGLAALELSLKQAIFSVVAFAVACVTETSSQFMVRLVGTVVLVPLGLGYCADIFGGPMAYLGDGLAESRYRLVVGIFSLIPVAMVAHQYVTRRTRRSYALLVAGIALMFAVRFGWQWDLSPMFRRFPEENAALNPTVRFTQQPATIEQRPKKNPALHLSGTVSGAPAGSYISLVSGRGWCGVGAGRRPGAKFTATAGAGRPPELAVRQAAGLRRPASEEVPWKAEGSEPDGLLAQAREDPTQFHVELQAYLMRGQVVGELPLREGATLQSGASHTRVVRVERFKGRLNIWLEERDAWPPWSARPADSFLLIDPAVAGETNLGTGEVRDLQFNSISIRQRELVIMVPTREVNGRSEEIPGWEDTAKLVKVRFSPGHRFTRVLTVDLPRASTP